ncbi:MAG: hypothetical protein J1E36_02850 [Eubacterium sp.]|nr:hypothetical protein [Eubacterium sp.]
MKKKDEKRRIIKVRPFNMANFSGGSGYLVFSLIYQTFALLPGVLIVWFLTLIKLPKDENGNIIVDRACKRFYAVTIPIAVLFIIASVILAIYCCAGYGDLSVYAVEIAFIGIAPTLCSFFVLRHFHSKIAHGEISVAGAIFASLGIIILIIIGVFAVSLTLNSILEEYEIERDRALFEAEIAEYDY